MKYTTLFLIIFMISLNAFAFETGSLLTEREIIESQTELKAGQVSLNKRFDDLRGEMKDGFVRMDKRFDSLTGFLMWGFGIIFTGIFALIGFVLWDRRTTLAPATKKFDALERTLIDYSDKHPDLKESLRHAGLL